MTSAARTVVAYTIGLVVAAALATAVTLTLPIGWVADLLARRIRPAPPTPQLHNVVTEIGLAIGEPADHILTHVCDTANVAMLPTRSHGPVVVATTGALQKLTRYELQALVAAQ